MRNTTMRDQLESLLEPETATKSSVSKPTHAGKAIRRPQAIHKPPVAETGNRSDPKDEPIYGPRYIDPRRKRNPFSIHAHPLIEVPQENPEPVKVQSFAAETEAVARKSLVSSPEESAELVSSVPAAEERIEAPRPESGPMLVALVAPPVAIPLSAAVAEDPVAEDLSIVPAQGSAPVPDAPLITVPSNLTWLEKPTPFGSDLRLIVDKSRDAKSSVVFTLEQTTARQKDLRGQIAELQRKLDQEEFLGEQQREYLRQLDEVIAACALVAEQSAGIEEILRPARGDAAKKHTDASHTPRTIGSGRWHGDEASMCRQKDILKFFALHAGTNWTAPEIREQLPLAKRAHAKEYLSVLLANLHKLGRIKRVGVGIYRSIEGGSAEA